MDIGCGDWDGMQEGLDIPAYSFERALEVSCERLEEAILQNEQKIARQAAPWHARWGITKISDQISEEGLAALSQYRSETQALRTPSAWSGAEFSYQTRC